MIAMPAAPDDLATLVAEIERLADSYRAGTPEVSDEVYDHVYLARLRKLAPDHPLLDRVEPEPQGLMGAPVRHSTPMLSTEKAYNPAQIEAWVARVRKVAEGLGIAAVSVRITAKLDGLAGCWDGRVLATRGDGAFGQDITRNIGRGLVIDKDLEGPGELVIAQSYFAQSMRVQYDMSHPRSFMVGLVAADTLQDYHREALAAQVCRFVSYQTLPFETMPIEELPARAMEALARLKEASVYLTDGAIVEVEDTRLREALGATSHHHRWMLALKVEGETAQTTVTAVTLQTGRASRITPVLEVEATQLSGAVIRRCTAHTARHIERLGLGPGARITLMRSGEVIPFLVSVEKRSSVPVDLSRCPSCGCPAEWDNDYLTCPNVARCPSQLAGRLEHFLTRIGINGFGPKICEQLVTAGRVDPIAVCGMNMIELTAAGIHLGVAANLEAAIVTRKVQVILDKDAVAAFSVRHLGRGDARKLLEVYPWQSFDRLTSADIERVSGFGAHTAALIAPHLATVCAGLRRLIEQGFRIEATVRASAIGETPIKGKKVVFTGSMAQPRDAMEQRARELGATVQSSVSGSTDLLIVGDKAGSKVEKAQKLGVTVMPVAEYLDLIGGAA